jgi:serine/threonine protein kinase
MRVREVIDVGIEIAHGLAAAHDAGIIHRDLKPENMFITKGGRTKILDFGLAKLDPSKTSSMDGPTASYHMQTDPRHVLGTVGYMSSAQVRGQVADAGGDIFAAGTVLYEMATGKRAFHTRQAQRNQCVKVRSRDFQAGVYASSIGEAHENCSHSDIGFPFCCRAGCAGKMSDC